MPDPARRRQRRGRGRVQQRVRRLRRHPGLDLHLGRAAARRARPRGGSAQTAGVDAGGGGILGGGGNPLTAAEPERYGELAHPGDDHSYDPFAQIGALVSTVPGAGTDPLGGLPRDHVLAIGEAQSAFRLTTFINGMHPRTPVFDGFLVHSRGGGAGPLRSSPATAWHRRSPARSASATTSTCRCSSSRPRRT